jgi:hypothetical protein
MDTNTPTQSSEVQVINGSINRWLLMLSIVLLILTVALAVWGFTERKRANDLVASMTGSEWSEADLTAFTSAFESGDYEQVRALFTEDGVLTTAANTHDAIFTGDTSRLADRIDETEFRRLATLHGGEQFHILGLPLQVGDNTVAFAWKWGDKVSGTALLHLRDGKIVIGVLNPSQYNIPFAGD